MFAKSSLKHFCNLKFIDSCEKALKMLPMAEMTSNLESESDNMIVGKKMKKKKKCASQKQKKNNYNSYSESDDGDLLNNNHMGLSFPPPVNINKPTLCISDDLADLNALIAHNQQKVVTDRSSSPRMLSNCSQQQITVLSPSTSVTRMDPIPPEQIISSVTRKFALCYLLF